MSCNDEDRGRSRRPGAEDRKPKWWRVSWFGPQNRQLWFGDLGLKITATVS
jgi:hypothetical protein